MTHADLAAAGFCVSPVAYARLARFVDALLAENQKLNLTAIRTPEDAWPLHVCDSLALLPLIDEANPRRLLDLGSGGGVPGIPLACVRDHLQVTLLDATRKKVAAAERIAAEIGLTNVRGVWGRAEVLGACVPHRSAYDAVVARAVAKLPQLLEWAAPFLRPGGQGWFMKSVQAAAEEIEASTKIASRLGLECAGVRTYRLPEAHGERAIVAYRSIRT